MFWFIVWIVMGVLHLVIPTEHAQELLSLTCFAVAVIHLLTDRARRIEVRTMYLKGILDAIMAMGREKE